MKAWRAPTGELFAFDCLAPVWVYFIQAGEAGPIKIGRSRDDPRQRLSALQTAHYETLRLLGVLQSDPEGEARLHEQFANLRIRGEWFRPGPGLLTLIAEQAETWSEEAQLRLNIARQPHRFDFAETPTRSGFAQKCP